MCPDIIIVLGEDLTRFRDASKENYHFLRSCIWSNRVERLGFDEVFLDVTDMIDYNMEFVNHHGMGDSFFHLDRTDPTVGFPFDASTIFGHIYPSNSSSANNLSSHEPDYLLLRLCLGSHLAQHLRHQLEEQKGYSSTVGISTNKLLSKLVGNMNKPKGQTTLVPPYKATDNGSSNVHQFIDDHDIGKIPGIGFKTAQKLRDHVLGRPAKFSAGLVYGGTKENVKVRDVRTSDGMGPKMLDQLLAAPGVPRDLGEKVWSLINGVDEGEVGKAKEVPQQISIEDSYIKLDELEEAKKELLMLAKSLLKRMRMDLTSLPGNDDRPVQAEETDDQDSVGADSYRRWIALPRTLRLSTRPRPPLNPNGTRSRTFARISKSGSMPPFVSNLSSSIEVLAERLVEETLMPLFRKLHPEKSGWNLSLVNVCATNMSLIAGDATSGVGRDIGKMFSRQEDVLKEWKVEGIDVAPSDEAEEEIQSEEPNKQDEQPLDISFLDDGMIGSEDMHQLTQNSIDDDNPWDNEGDSYSLGDTCSICGAAMPQYAMVAHERFHTLPD